jgi:DNA adenine methylase
MKPLVKWTGGKRKLSKLLLSHVPSTYGCYHEPFLGGGAFLFALQPARARVGDLNADLINLYREVKRDAHGIISLLKTYENTPEFYYKVRAQEPTDPQERAVRFLYLSRAGFNGLYRVNRAGKFNVAYGKYKSLQFDFENILEVSAWLNQADIDLNVGDYQATLSAVAPGDFVYMDPPYHGTFTGYTAEQFDSGKLQAFAEFVHGLVAKDVKVLISNANHPDVWEAFKKYQIIPVDVSWTISQKGSSRAKKENEILIKTY